MLVVDDAWRELELTQVRQVARLGSFRYTSPSRWSEWKREPFTSESHKHVSVWKKPAALTDEF